jgi:murein DD-endopeptidase MepM/ murein hydrolase activator NlpD
MVHFFGGLASQARHVRTFALSCSVLAFSFGCKTMGSKTGTTPVSKTVYQVKVEKGDTLATIAKQFGTTWQSVVALNKTTLKSGLQIGQVLRVQPGPTGIVKLSDHSEAMSHNHEHFEDPFESEGLPRSDRPKHKEGMLFGPPKVRSATKKMSFIFPSEGSISSSFGMRRGKLHKGIDIRSPLNSPIRAAASGEVTFSGRKRGYGNTIIVDHGKYATLYAHCSKLIARVGDIVKQGDYIAKVGKTGNARGIHLHFEIRDHDNRPVDPESLLPNSLISMAGF